MDRFLSTVILAIRTLTEIKHSGAPPVLFVIKHSRSSDITNAILELLFGCSI